ncbi:RNA recognition motif domain-containing protein [Foetidibacter luteolus]|uniref:RNA recognition motif domain-containing protein n=1 Tax=Foetidibacter luteolus TaxID=2608880 RepID=UPI00129B6831|nr:RNA-binding protein [Foetidibacter luteolus]
MRFTVTGLPKDFTETDLEELFLPFGRITFAKIYIDPLSLKSRGRGLVEMPVAEQAETAMQQLQAKQIGEHTIKLKVEPYKQPVQHQENRRPFQQRQPSFNTNREDDGLRRRRTRMPLNRSSFGQ